MTTDSTTPDPQATNHPAATSNAAEQPSVTEDDNSDRDPSSNEAAKYRRRLREVEAERDQLANLVKAANARELAAVVADTDMRPEDFQLLHPDVDAFIDPATGTIDPAAVAAAVEAATSERPHLKISYSRPRALVVPGEGIGPSDTSSRTGWSDIIKAQ